MCIRDSDRALRAAKATPDWPERDRARLFLGVCRLLTGDAGSAVEPLQRAARSSSPGLSERARWFLAQAFLGTGDGEAATSTLRELAESGEVYATVAAEQLRELEELATR